MLLQVALAAAVETALVVMRGYKCELQTHLHERD
jgi:hypothetical protein